MSTSPAGPIGVFDSGYGGLTVFKEIAKALPDYDYIYLGDNARAPYGVRSFDTVYEYTLQCVEALFKMNCSLVILACNTASAKALRSIQQRDLPRRPELRRVLGVIRPTTELLGELSQSGHVGIFATQGTVNSQSYVIETQKFFPGVQVHQEACPMWVPLVENREHQSPGADYFVKRHVEALLQQSPRIDTILLGCTHYPLLMDKIRAYTPAHIRLVPQGEIVARSLADYLQRHPEIEHLCTRGGRREFFTTEKPEDFNSRAATFLGQPVEARYLHL
ncbi:glutamate racemase [Cesiribacter andamanensis]|uniref:Glutamate racemase n=1 Tax=Cesiribacter andamanensis AMV16 TaxID=1279009 RepID=M7NQJ2_9BACT|nr:glutamate racemase [Cesiribacter andamanensis]EMR03995.1 Glutamate racemase [Cesiribacter andamanensis AMV16]